jgi:hypothetical protein
VRLRACGHTTAVAESDLRALLAAAAASPDATVTERRALAPFVDAAEPLSQGASAAAAAHAVASLDAPAPTAPPPDAWPLSSLTRLAAHSVDVPALLAEASAMAPSALAQAVQAAGPPATHHPSQLHDVLRGFPDASAPELAALVCMLIASAGARFSSVCCSMRPATALRLCVLADIMPCQRFCSVCLQRFAQPARSPSVCSSAQWSARRRFIVIRTKSRFHA